MFPGEQRIGVSACVHYNKLLVCQDESSCMTTVLAVPLVQRAEQRKRTRRGKEG